VVNGTNIFQMLLVVVIFLSRCYTSMMSVRPSVRVELSWTVVVI